MVCGTSSFKHLDGDDDPRAPMATSPKGSKKKASNKIKNPYSTRGLDKFSAVLSELESRRQKIMARAGSQGVAMVQFMYESTNDWIPIVVRLRDRKVDVENKVSGAQKPAPALAGDGGAGEGAGGAKKTVAAKEERNKGNKGFAWRGWRESHSWVLVVVVILVCIVVFGRAFAICCTCICWYLVPSMNERGGGGGGGSKKGREYARRLSEKRLGANSRVLANKVMNNMGRRE